MSVISLGEKEPWIIDFENEEINDERWSCLVSAFVGSKPEDEECIRMFTQFVEGKAPIIRTISISDVVALFKRTGENKKRSETKVKVKRKLDTSEESTSQINLSPRFPEVVLYLSKYVVISNGSCTLPPKLMAYAIKYLVIILKDQDYYQRRVARMARRRNEQAEAKAEVLKMFNIVPQERANVSFRDTGELWRKERFDIFGHPLKDGPFQGPELYIALCDFYDPFVFPELLKLHVPFRSVIKVESVKLMNEKLVNGKRADEESSKKSDLINNFWELLQENREMDDIALLKYVAPAAGEENVNEMPTVIATGIISIMYSIYNVSRLHQTYLEQMKVQRMIESLEPLDLAKCIVYNKLCDALVVEDPKAEVFILFSIIEQVVAGVPETESRASDDKSRTSSPLVMDEVSTEIPPEGDSEPEELVQEKYPPARTATVCFYDDKISLASLSIDPDILRPSEIFERFLITSILQKIRKKFFRLSPALKAQSEFSFYQMWLNSKENKDVFRVKLWFLVIMRLIERIRAFDGDCEDISSRTDTIPSPNGSFIEKTKTSEESLSQSWPEDPNLSQIDELFYKKIKLPDDKYMKTSSTVTRQVRKADAILVLDKKSIQSVENLEVACGRCPRLILQDKPTDQQIELKKLEAFLESHEITTLTDPNLLANKEHFEAFVKRQEYYETFEPNRTVQRLQELYDEYNTIDYTYFTPTDTLFVLGYNDTDLRGVYHSFEGGFIPSPLHLRHFIRYTMPENKKWVAEANRKYIKFLKGIERMISNEEKKRIHELRCEMVKKYNEMTESERKKFLDEGSTEVGRKSTVDPNANETPDEALFTELEDLPIKIRQRRPEMKFFGIDSGGIRMQVNVDNYQFHSQDGCKVFVKTQSWQHMNSVVTLIIQRVECRLIVHRQSEDSEKSLMLFREPSGILVTFGMDHRPFPVRMTQPNGLIIEIGKASARYVKQTYLEPYRPGEDLSNEKYRCCSHDGSVLIFREDETIDVLCPSGTKHKCYMNASGDVEVHDTLTPTGELWMRDDCSKCKPTMKTMTVLTKTDSETNETYYKREDGMTCMLWQSGKLVTTYPDGTKITTTPKFEETLVFETEDQEGDMSTASERSNIRSSGSSGEDQPAENTSGFIVVNCSYLMEHPNYATVYSEPSKLEIRILRRMKVKISSAEYLKIECCHAVLRVSSETAVFYTVCRHCGKPSLSTVYFDSKNLFSVTRDYYGQEFYVYNSGQILHEPNINFNTEEEKMELFGESPRSQGTKCEYHKYCKSQRRCLAVERDLTGLEFIDSDTFRRYQGSLSEDAYYDLGRMSDDNAQLQHGFFNPLYHVGREKYKMKYEQNDGFPINPTRKILKNGDDVQCLTNSGRKKRKELPKAIIARFIHVLLPDPMTVMKSIIKQIVIYQRRSLDLSGKFYNTNKRGKQGPFAKYIAKELELIASTLCPSLTLYPHTCSLTPYTEMDIHSAAHDFERNSFFVESNPDDCQTQILPPCKRIPKPLKHKGNDEPIPEICGREDDDELTTGSETLLRRSTTQV